ncbi:MAG: phosphate acyltransferase PlsX [Gammaproteobacteria bacterium]
MITIAIDAMGGDHGIKITVPAALLVLQKWENVKLILVGDEVALKQELSSRGALSHPRITIHHAAEVVEMDEAPAKALRGKKQSSMRLAINLVKDGVAGACVSAGNTGALMATAHYVLKTIPGIDRPAIIRSLPTLVENKNVIVLDLGASSDSSPENLYQFAVMGSVLASAHYNIEKPKVALLNIGVEEIKGNELVKAADKLFLQSQSFEYVGYVEGDAIFQGDVDVVVCDGFVGNVALKAMEGVIKLTLFYAKKAFMKNLFNKIAALIARPALKTLAATIDPGRHNGASLIGLKGIVIKSHGGANESAFTNAIYEAMLEVEKNVPQKIGEKVGLLLRDEHPTS